MSENRTHWIKAGVRGQAPVDRHKVDTRLHRLQWNENPFDFPADLKEEVIHRLSELSWARYPLGLRPWALIDRIAAHTGVQPDQVVVGDGSSDLIRVVMNCVLHPGDTVVMPAPTFLLYRQNARLLQANSVEVHLSPDDDFALPVDELIEAGQVNEARMVVLCAPNNPTGTVYPIAELRRLAEGCTGLLVVDEAYGEFCDQDLTSLLALGNVVLMRTFSKLYAMAGVRVGYALSTAALASEFQKGVNSFPLSVFSEISAEVALDHHDRFLALRDQIVAERERVCAVLGAMPGLHVFSSGTNFILVQLHRPRKELLDYLHGAHDLLLSDMASYPELKECVRISIGTPAQNDLVIRGFKEHFA